MGDTWRCNAVDQQLDVIGSINQSDTLTPLTDESSMLGAPIAGQTGGTATLTAGASTATITGLTGLTDASVGNFLQIEDSSNPGSNDGTWLITEVTGATTATIALVGGVTEGPGTFTWTERQPYSLEDDLNYVRTDRSAIKGVAYDQPVPTYVTCDGTVQPANLANIAGKTTDAKLLVINRRFSNATPTTGDGYVTICDTGNLPHSDGYTGVPIWDGADAGDHESTYVDVIDGYDAGLFVLSGPNAGNRIFGRTRAGTTGVDPNCVEVEFRSVPYGDDVSTGVAYTWEAGQPTTIDLIYPYRSCLDDLDENALRVTLVNGLISDSGIRQNVVDLQTVIGVDDGDTDLGGLLGPTTDYYPFSDLPDATPSVVEALNTLNQQIGPRDYDGYILTDGYTITQSLQELADAISAGAVNITRVIERLSSAISAGTEHTLPGGNSYTLDANDNGQGLWVFWRGLLRDPGLVANGDDYEETSTTSITPYYKIKNKDHINYFIIGS